MRADRRMIGSAALPADKAQANEMLVRDVVRGLTARRKFIPSKYLYDAVGSALFDAICHLSEYNCTRGEKRILQRYAPEIAAAVPPDTALIELGGGNGDKAALILPALVERQGSAVFHNIDISRQALQSCKSRVSELQGVSCYGHVDEFESGLLQVRKLTADTSVLVAFLGSSIGNYTRADATRLLRSVHACLKPLDTLLLGTDLVKPKQQLIDAYDDPQGVTAAFNKNLLARLNRELQATFDIRAFRHEARWSEELRRIEMHLVSTCAQSAIIGAASLTVSFAEGESIHTENSHKYVLSELTQWLSNCGFEAMHTWVDEDSQFATTLLRVK